MFRLFLPVFVGVVITLRVLRKPEELAIFALGLSSTLPVISQGYLLAYGRKGLAFRVEYVLVLLGIFLAVWGRLPCLPQYKSKLRTPVFLMFLIHVMTILVSLYWETPFGLGVTIRLLETFLFFFLFVRLTRREHIGKLVHAFIAVGAVVAGILLLTSITGNTSLYEFIFRYEVPIEETRFYKQFYLGVGVPRIWLRYADEFLPLAGVMVFLLFLLKREHKILYGLLSLMLFVRVVLSGQRFFSAVVIFGYILCLLLLSRIEYIRVRLPSILIIVLIFILITSALFVYVPVLRTRYDLLTQHFMNMPQDLSGERQYMGAVLAREELFAGGWFAWLMGFGGFVYGEIGWTGYDINTPILMIYRFGLVGLFAILFLLIRAFKLGWHMLNNLRMSPEELAVVVGVMLYIVTGLVGSFLRGFSFSENFQTLSGFIILLAWMEVIYRDSLVAQLPAVTSKRN